MSFIIRDKGFGGWVFKDYSQCCRIREVLWCIDPGSVLFDYTMTPTKGFRVISVFREAIGFGQPLSLGK